jgi:tetratricopeptide (TPR) repeat protein
MSRLLMLSVTTALLGHVSSGWAAKPPELPQKPIDTCQVYEPSGVPADGYSCPYMKQKQHSPQPAVTDASDLANGVLENLAKLKRAEKLYRKAEQMRQNGQVDQACQLYEEMRRLCPGSRYDELASKALDEVRAAAQPDDAYGWPCVPSYPPQKPVDAEERQNEPSQAAEPGCPSSPAPSRPASHARINRMLKECRRALDAGDYEAAEELILRAALRVQMMRRKMYIHQPDGDCPGAIPEPLFQPDEEAEPFGGRAVPGVPEEVLQLLQSARESMKAGRYGEAEDYARKALTLDPGCGEADALLYLIGAQPAPSEQYEIGEPPVEQQPEGVPPCDADRTPGVILQPALPPIDPKIVDAMEKVLAEVGTLEKPRLVIEPVEAGVEEAEEPAATWPFLPSDESDIPKLYVPPAETDLILETEDDEEQDVPEQGSPEPFDCWLELTGNDPGGLPYCYRNRRVVEQTIDLQASQLAQNQHIIDWIMESSSGAANSEEDGASECIELDDCIPGALDQ